VQYFKMAADQGHSEGQLNLGTLYFSGDGVKQDYSKALTYFALAAQQGNLVALFNLGHMHQHGLGTTTSCSLAVQLYKKVAEKGPWTAALLEEAFALFEEEDYEGALMLYEQVAELGLEVAQCNSAWIHDKGFINLDDDGINATLFQLASKKFAFEHYKNCAEQRNAVAHLRLGDYYFFGFAGLVDYEKSVQHYQIASDMRSSQAMFNLGYMHQFGLGLPRDLHLAKRYFDMALEVDSASYLAVYLALARLATELVLESGFAAILTPSWIPTRVSPVASSSIPSSSLDLFLGMQWDTLLLVILMCMLVLCVLLRAR